MKLSILIPTLNSRFNYFNNLMKILAPQQITGEVEIIYLKDDGELSIGEKRNQLLKKAIGDYVCFVDDDDEVSKNYVSNILKAIEQKPDCCSITGVMTWDGIRPELFCHSIKYKAYKTNTNNEPIIYERYPNHLNPIKRSIAIKYLFVPINHGEDTEWATQIFNAGELKTEAEITEVMYHYKYRTNK